MWVKALLTLSFGVTTYAAEIPPEARALLNEIPGQKITVEFVVGAAIRSSDGFRALAAQKVRAETAGFKAEAPLDTFVSMGAGWSDDRSEATNPFSTESVKGDQISVGVSKSFITGTTLSAELTQGYTNMRIVNMPTPIRYYENKATLGLSQKLWKDSFGYATRRSLEAGKLQSEAMSLAFQDGFESLTLKVMDLFYGAWMAQARVDAAKENLARRKRLLSSTQIRARRGTAEAPDLLQVKSAVLSAENEYDAAVQVLRDQWRELVVFLKLPESLMDLDPMLVPMVLDGNVANAKSVCAAMPPKLTEENKTTVVKHREATAKAADLNFEAAKNNMWPNLELAGTYSGNGVDTYDRVEAAKEMEKFDNPHWTVGVSLSMPLGRSAEKATLAEAGANKIEATAAMNQARDGFRTEWLSKCASLTRLEAAVARAKAASENQVQRAKLDEERFRIGRSTIFSVVQAGDDATLSEIGYSSAQVALRQMAWSILRMNDGLQGFYKTLEQVKR